MDEYWIESLLFFVKILCYSQGNFYLFPPISIFFADLIFNEFKKIKIFNEIAYFFDNGSLNT